VKRQEAQGVAKEILSRQKENISVHRWLSTSMGAQRGCGISFLGNTPDLTH